MVSMVRMDVVGECPKVTVVVPVYNSADNIGNLVSFLGEQAFRDFETVFVVDSRSDDGTLGAVERHAPALGRWSVIIQETQGGLGEARNMGLDAAAGEYVWFLDSDDRPYPEFLEALVSLADEHGADVAQCNFVRSSDLGLEMPKGRYAVKVMDSAEALHNRASEITPITSWSFVFRRDFLVDNGIYFATGRFCEDIDHTYRALDACNKLCYYDKPLYLYHQNEGSMCFLNQNSRGWGEVAAYTELDGYFSSRNPEFHEFFGQRSALMRIRSATHMDRENFLEYMRSDERKRMSDRHLRDPVSPEGVAAALMPTLYHIAVNLFLKFFYYKDARLFDTKAGKRRGLQPIRRRR